MPRQAPGGFWPGAWPPAPAGMPVCDFHRRMSGLSVIAVKRGHSKRSFATGKSRSRDSFIACIGFPSKEKLGILKGSS